MYWMIAFQRFKNSTDGRYKDPSTELINLRWMSGNQMQNFLKYLTQKGKENDIFFRKKKRFFLSNMNQVPFNVNLGFRLQVDRSRWHFHAGSLFLSCPALGLFDQCMPVQECTTCSNGPSLFHERVNLFHCM